MGSSRALGRLHGKCGRVLALRELRHYQETLPLSSEPSSDSEKRFSELTSGWHSDLFDKSWREENLWGENITHRDTYIHTLP